MHQFAAECDLCRNFVDVVRFLTLWWNQVGAIFQIVCIFLSASVCEFIAIMIINLPRKIGDARHEWADPWPKNWPNAISNSIIGMPTNRNNIKYGSKNATPCRSSSRGKRTTFAYVRFKHRHNITSRNIEHFDCEIKKWREKKEIEKKKLEEKREKPTHTN